MLHAAGVRISGGEAGDQDITLLAAAGGRPGPSLPPPPPGAGARVLGWAGEKPRASPARASGSGPPDTAQ